MWGGLKGGKEEDMGILKEVQRSGWENGGGGLGREVVCWAKQSKMQFGLRSTSMLEETECLKILIS